MEIEAYEAAQREKARALKRKFYPTNHVQVRRALPEPVVCDLPAFMHLIPSWKKDPTHFDEHMIEWRRIVQDMTLSPIRAYIRRRAPQLGFTYEDMKTKSRRRPLVHARFLIMWEIKRYIKTTASFQEIGNAFGGFDHTACIHAIQTVDRWKEEALEGAR